MRFIVSTKVFVSVFLAVGQTFSSVEAAVVTSPSGSSSDGNGQSVSPFANRGDTNGNRYQQVFSSNLFSSIGDTQSISSIAFRQRQPAFGNFISPTVTFSNITFALSTTSRNADTDFPNGLNADLSTNVGVDSKLVFSGPLTLTSLSTSRFDYLINFQTPFLYRPGLGNLLLEVVIPSGALITTPGSIGFTQFAQYTDGFPSRDGTASALDMDLSDGSTIGSNSTTGAVAQFTVNSAPEPSTGMAFCVLALAAGTIFRWNRSKTSRVIGVDRVSESKSSSDTGCKPFVSL